MNRAMHMSPSARRSVGVLSLALIGLLAAGCGRSPTFTPSGEGAKLSVRIAKADAFAGAEELTPPVAGENWPKVLFASKESVLTNADLRGTGIRRDPSHEKSWQVELFFTKAGTDKYARLTKENVGNYMVIFVNDKLETAAKIHAETKEAIIGGGFTEAEATSLAKKLVGQ